MTQVFVRRGGTQTNGCAVVLEPGANLQTGESKFKTLFGGITTLEADLLLIAATIFAVDRCLCRGEREEFVRGIEISIPVVNIGRLQPVRPILEDLLRTLSNDAWRVTFRQESGKTEDTNGAQPSSGSTLLFSGEWIHLPQLSSSVVTTARCNSLATQLVISEQALCKMNWYLC